MKWLPNTANVDNEENPVLFFTKNKDGKFKLFRAKTFPWRIIAICLALSLVVFLLFSSNSRAQGIMEGLLCDTQEQVTQIMKAQNRPAELALVNAESPVCGILMHFSVKVRVVDEFVTPEGDTEIWELTTFALSFDGETMIPLQGGTTQYAPFFAVVSPAVHKPVGIQA